MSNHRPGIGSSRYRQIRVTATHETNGRFSVSVYAKPLNKEWHERHCLYRFGAEGVSRPLETTEDVLSALVYLLEAEMLPRHRVAAEPPGAPGGATGAAPPTP